MIFHQLFEPESSTYTYVLADEATGEAILIDPVKETMSRDLKLLTDLQLQLKYIVDTHVHADHITSAGPLRDLLSGEVRTAVSASAGVACVDRTLQDGDRLKFGQYELRVIATPGHTDSCISLYLESEAMVFTGDALLIGGTGRTDFQQGSSDSLYDSVTKKLFALPESTRVFPAHDYKGRTESSIAVEKSQNPRLGGGRTKEEFKKIMRELKLAQPKKINEALPANLRCGRES